MRKRLFLLILLATSFLTTHAQNAAPTADRNYIITVTPFWAYIFNNKSITINIENVNIHCFNVEICDGVFSYKGYPFYFSGIFLDDLFEETGQTINKRMVKRKDMEYIVDVGLQWTFFYEDENFRVFTFDD